MNSVFLRSFVLSCAFLFLAAPCALAWEISDKAAYLEKMAILKSMLAQAASKPDNIREVCLIMSIGNDVNYRYLLYNENDTEEQERGDLMVDQLSTCLAGLYLFYNKHPQ